MAKKEKSEFDQIISDFGNVIKSGISVADSKPTIIPISPSLDIATGGGFHDGCTITLAGPAKCGKSLTSLWMAANAQKLEYTIPQCPLGREVFYFDIEARLKPRDLHGVPHLDLSRFTIIGSSANDLDGKGGKILMAQDYLSIAEKIIHQKPGAVIIMDSFTALVTEEEYQGSMNDMQRASGAKLLYKFFRKISNVIPVQKTILLGICHVIANPQMGSPNTTASGRAVQYFSDYNLLCKYISLIKPGGKDSTDNPIGQEVHWQIVCSGLGGPGATPTGIIKYGRGIDKEEELANLCVDLGIISKSGSWFSFPGDDKKLQGIEKVRLHLVETPQLYEDLFKQVKDLMGIQH